ncbi:MAG: thiamine pyrophosphate-requiring protein [Deltaproteobacteria bacterium]|nr:thiamine pyrophosphate-requiring protein [Deltaproteobacteria bacterium]
MKVKFSGDTVAHALLELLSLRGIEYFFANAGTDFASIVEAFALREKQGKGYPVPFAVPHEIPLVGMAHGYYLGTGRPQAAMVHVTVGTANSIGGLMAANRARIPILFFAGRTPITEDGDRASRQAQIHWGQESFDQGGMVREFVKWEYELREPSQLETVIDRAVTMAMTQPRGPVYLSLPREVTAAPLGEIELRTEGRFDLPTFHPDPAKIKEAARLLLKARFPLIITSAIGQDPSAVQTLVDVAEAGAVGVVSFKPGYVNFPGDHPCHLGFSPAPYFEETDVIFVVDCDVPWFPRHFKPMDSAVVIQAGVDPFYSNYPIRGFHSDLTLQGDPALVLSEIARELAGDPERDEDALARRQKKLQGIHDGIARKLTGFPRGSDRESPLDFGWISHNLARFTGDDTIVVNEYGNAMEERLDYPPGGYFGPTHAGYLGWSFGTALGLKLAQPEKTVILTVGDGAYMFSVPSACHFVSNANRLPLLVVVYNNRRWNAVKRATLGVHPEGVASRSQKFPLSSLEPTGDYEKICEAFGGYGEKVEDPGQVLPALERAFHAVRVEKRQALLNIICK